jgi:hypothetical protein
MTDYMQKARTDVQSIANEARGDRQIDQFLNVLPVTGDYLAALARTLEALDAALEDAALWKQSEQAASDQFDKMAARADKAEAELQALREAAQALVNQVGPQNTRVYRSDPVMQTLIAALTRKEA